MEFDQAQNDIFVEMSARLRSERQRLGLKQDDFARLGGVSTQTQTRYETGQFLPKLEYLQALSKHGVDATFVLVGQRAGYVLGDEEYALLDGFAQLDSGYRPIIMALIGQITGKSPDLPRLYNLTLPSGTLHDKVLPFKGEERGE